MKPTYFRVVAVAFGLLLVSGPARGSSLTWDIFDSTLYSGTEDFPEGFRISSEYGSRITSTTTTASNGTTMFEYEIGAEGATPNVVAYYGPYSIFTGGPDLWRYDYGDLDRVLYQGSRHDDPDHPLGNNYDVLEIALVADPGYDVLLHGFDLGGWQADYVINAVTAFDGIPFPFLTPTNQIYGEANVLVEGAGSHTEFDFGVIPSGPLQAHVIWLRIDASNLGSDSELIGIDNIRFGQIASNNFEDINPADIKAALQQPQVPEASSLVMCLLGLGGTCGAMAYGRRRPYAIG